MKTLLREPLLHFVLIGAAVFAFYAWAGARADKTERTIHISAAEMERMAALYTSEAGTLPSAQDVQAMLASYVRDIALAREARRLGLDKDDTIIERRLAQKMSFMISDLETTPKASEAELRAHYAAHADRFERPGHISFRHVFIAQGSGTDTESLLAALNAASPPDWKSLGDPFMMQREYGDLPPREITRIFGQEFTRALTQMKAQHKWTGPVSSAFGQHLIWLSQNDPPSLPPFDEVRAAVEADWQDEARRRANEEAITDIVARYDVIIEGANK